MARGRKDAFDTLARQQKEQAQPLTHVCLDHASSTGAGKQTQLRKVFNVRYDEDEASNVTGRQSPSNSLCQHNKTFFFNFLLRGGVWLLRC